MTEVEKALNSLNGTVLDYDMINNGTLFALVVSKAGNYSVRQSFRNCYGEYQGWTIVKRVNHDAILEFDAIVYDAMLCIEAHKEDK